jgi:hypothetical protein
MQRGDKQLARGFASRFAVGVARCFALVWLGPALLFNVDWTGHGSWQANVAAVTMIAGSALFIEGAMRLRSWVLTPVCILAALFLVYVNTKQATRVLSLAGETASEARAATIAGGSQLASQGSQLLARRAEQAKIAGEATVGTLEAQLKALQLADVRAWTATSGCEDVTAKASGVFCARVAEARAKIAAAKERDKLDAELAALPVPKLIVMHGAEAPVADPYVANVVAVLKELGLRPTERIIRAEESISRALGFELLAALGPTCWLAFVGMIAGVSGHASAAAAARARRGAKPEKGAEVSAVPENADDYDRCIADLFQPEPAGVMSAKAIRPLVQAWFATKGLQLDESKLWVRMGGRFKRDRNNGRPRYLGLKARVKGPLRLAMVSAA